MQKSSSSDLGESLVLVLNDGAVVVPQPDVQRDVWEVVAVLAHALVGAATEAQPFHRNALQVLNHMCR